jgi:2-polyprenyl-3-methyl-5-hydroxy-6-metoxy-1,4-benzoquinol methylase
MKPEAARYDSMADFYDETVGDSVSDPATEALLDLAGDLRGMHVVEVACGQGRVARELARRGARVVGVDLSAALLDRARQAELARPMGIAYVRANVATWSAGEASFDAAICNYGLSDIDDLDGALKTIKDALRPGGIFVWSILHPCFPGWGPEAPRSWSPGGYYQEGWWLADNLGFRGKVGANHRMLSTYFNALILHGFVLQAVVEPEPGLDWSARFQRGVPVPVYLVVQARRR